VKARLILTLVLALGGTEVAFPSVAAAAEPQPRHNLRLGLAMGQALVVPPVVCSGCDRFWGRALSFLVDVGWTLRPNIVLSLEQQVAVIYFADGTDGALSASQLAGRYFWRERAWLLAAAGVGFRDVTEDERPDFGIRTWSHTGPVVTVGTGYEPGRRGAWSFDLQARATVIVADGVAPAVMVLLGGSWN
jgi:hypothetical protein